MARGEVKYRLTVDTKSFESGMDAAAKQVSGLANTFTSKLGPAGDVLGKMGPVAIGASVALGAVASAANLAAEAVLKLAAYADRLSALKDQTGLSTKALQEFDLAAKLGNTSTEAIAAAVNKMQNNLINGSKAFGMLGIEMGQFKKLAPEDQLRVVAQQIEKLGTDAEKSAARIAIFGKGGNVAAGALKAIASGAAEMGGALSDEAVQGAADLQDELDRLGTAWDRVLLQIGAVIARNPQLLTSLQHATQAIADMAVWIDKNAAAIGRWIEQAAKYVQWAYKIATIGSISPNAGNLFKGPAGGAGGGFGGAGGMFPNTPATTGGPPTFNPQALAAAEAAEKAAKRAQEAWQKAFEKAREENDKFNKDMESKGHAALWALADDQSKAAKQMAENDRLRFEAWIEELHDAEIGAFEEAEDAFEEQAAVQEEAHQQMLADLESIAGIFHQIGGKGFGMLGDMLDGVVSIEHSLDKWQNAGKGFGGTLSKISAGLGIASAAFGIGKSIFGALGLGGNKEHMQVNDMRDEFVKAAGGIDVLNQKAHAAGMTLDSMLKAKTVNDYEAAIKSLNGAMDLHGQAMSALQQAQEKYQIGWSQLDQTAGGLLKDQNLLIAAGFSQQEVAKGMASAYSEYVQQVIEGGGTIPEAMRSTIELLQQQGLLVDENGEAFDDATVKGLNFTDKLTDQMSKLVDEIHRMVNALLGINDVDLNIHGRVTTGGGNERPPRFEEENSFAEGTGGFRDFGSGTPAMLHGTEGVFRPQDIGRMLAGAGGRTTVVRLQIGNREFGQAVAESDRSGRVRQKQSLRRLR